MAILGGWALSNIVGVLASTGFLNEFLGLSLLTVYAFFAGSEYGIGPLTSNTLYAGAWAQNLRPLCQGWSNATAICRDSAGAVDDQNAGSGALENERIQFIDYTAGDAAAWVIKTGQFQPGYARRRMGGCNSTVNSINSVRGILCIAADLRLAAIPRLPDVSG